MSHDSSAARASRSSPHYPPCSRSPSPTSSRSSPLPSHLSGRDAERSSSDNYLSPAHAHHATPSTSTHQTNSFLPPPPALFAHVPFSLGPYHPAPPTNTRYPAPIHPPANLQPVQPSITVRQPDLTYQNYAIHPQPEQVVSQQGKAYHGKGMFNRSQKLSFSDNTFIDNSINSEYPDNFMDKLLQHTIIGAEFDSSDRHPPPKCHPGTRLAIIERCKNFVDQDGGKEKMRWVVGGAGVGKSAIMQIVAEEIPADASVFFSVNGRNDGTKFFATIAYQLAVKYEPYRQFIQNAINHDPSLLRKSLPAQFRKFIVDPFIHQHLLNPSQRFVIIIDGLDECDNPKTQREILGLISDFCIKYSASPVVWFVASRPEPHITSFFDNARVTPAYTKEEVEIDSDEACKDVEQYLRDELNEVKLAYPTLRHKREWPTGLEFTKIATAAGGLFAYASTVVRYIGNSHYRDPATLLRHVLEVIDEGFNDDVSRKDHPIALLDALYRRILSNIPPDVMVNTRKLLLTTWWHKIDALITYIYDDKFRHTCNMLGLSEAAAYNAVAYLHAALKVPTPDEADNKNLEFFHKSFPDFLLDFKRSGFSRDAKNESDQLQAQCSLWIVTQVSDAFVDSMNVFLASCGYLRGCPDFCNNISLSWAGDERFRVSDDELKLGLYCNSMADICDNFASSCNYLSIPTFHALTTRFNAPGHLFPLYILRDCALVRFRPELTELGKVKEVPLRTLDYAAICGMICIRFTRPIGMDVKHSDHWNPYCTHRKRDVDGSPQQRVWDTDFWRLVPIGSKDNMAHVDIPRFNIMTSKISHRESTFNMSFDECLYCSRRLAHFFIDHPDQVATVFVDSTEMSYVELSFVDPDDGVSEWRYRFFHSGRPSDFN